MPAGRRDALRPAMPPDGPPECAQARWVGSCDLAELTAGRETEWSLSDGEDYRFARLLIRAGPDVCGQVCVEVRDGRILLAELRRAADRLPRPAAVVGTPFAGPVSVVICTRDRAPRLRQALASVLAHTDPATEVVVVDNASVTEETALVVAEAAEERVRLVREPVPGISRARNAGALAARGKVLAFVDDDVVVDPTWLAGVRQGFGRAPDVGCVTGPVPGGELRTATQLWFEQRVTWGGLLAARIYRLGESHPDLPLFPLQVGAYGTGANMAFRREAYLGVGGCDETLGAGTLVKGGEDLDLFLRVLLHGWALAVEPAALVWHRHRADVAALDSQVIGYGRGLGGWAAKLLTAPGTASLTAGRLPAALRRIRGHCQPPAPGRAAEASRLRTLERWSLATGPWHYLRSRLQRRPRALLPGR